jgi:hypothetical protein
MLLSMTPLKGVIDHKSNLPDQDIPQHRALLITIPEGYITARRRQTHKVFRRHLIAKFSKNAPGAVSEEACLGLVMRRRVPIASLAGENCSE